MTGLVYILTELGTRPGSTDTPTHTVHDAISPLTSPFHPGPLQTLGLISHCELQNHFLSF